MREKVLFLAGMMIALMIAGCLSSSQQGGQNETSNATGGEDLIDVGAEVVIVPFTVHDGLQNASDAVTKLRADSVLMQVYGECDSSGKSTQWQYSFNSKEAMTGYEVSVPSPESRVRNTAFSAKRNLPAGWIDSTEAVSKCGHGGECTLEMSGSIPVWNVISETDACTIDASSGAKIDS